MAAFSIESDPHSAQIQYFIDFSEATYGKLVEIQKLLQEIHASDDAKEMKGKKILLHFGAVDWEAHVFVNGKEVGRHSGGYDPFTLDVTSALKPAE